MNAPADVHGDNGARCPGIKVYATKSRPGRLAGRLRSGL